MISKSSYRFLQGKSLCAGGWCHIGALPKNQRADGSASISAHAYQQRAAGSGVEENVISSPHNDLPDLKGATLVEVLRSTLNPKWSNKIAYEDVVTGLRFTHNEIFKLSRNFAAALYQAGMKRGDIVGVVLPNSPYFPVVFFGLLEAGIVANFLSPSLPPSRIGYRIKETLTTAIITSEELAPVFLNLRSSTPIRKVFTTGPANDCHNIKEMIKTDSNGATFPSGSDSGVPESAAVILWSAGATELPRPTAFNNESFLAQLYQVTHPAFSPFGQGTDVILGAIPFYHGYANICMMRIVSAVGAKIVTWNKFSLPTFTATVKKHKPTVIHTVPPLIGIISSNDLLGRKDFEQLHTITTAASPTSPGTLEKLLRKVGDHIFFQEMYGEVEAGLTHATPLSHKNKKFGSIGQLLPNIEAKILTPDGTNAGAGEKGEMLIRGPQTMIGYLNDEQATQYWQTAEGWTYTGDECSYDQDGFFYMHNSIKGILRVKGYQVSPFVLQGFINSHPKVKACTVVGIPNDRVGQLPKAYVVRKDKTLNVDELMRHVEARIAVYERLLGGIEFVERIPQEYELKRINDGEASKDW